MSPKKPLVPQTAWGRLLEAAPEEGVQPLKNAKRIETRLIYADPRQPRKRFDEPAMQELIHSVEQRGILQPITVQADGQGRFFVVTGERRWRAAVALDLPDMPAIVVDLTEPEQRLDRVIENRQRQDLTDMEFADALEEIKADIAGRAPNLTSNELDEHVGERLGISGRTVRSFIALNHLPADIQAILGSLRTELRTRGLARLREAPDRQRALADAVVAHNLSGRQTVAAAQMLRKEPALPVAEAVAQVLAAEADAARPERDSYPHVRQVLIQAGTHLRAAARGAALVPLTAARVRELHGLLEPLVALYGQLGTRLAQIDAGQDIVPALDLAAALPGGASGEHVASRVARTAAAAEGQKRSVPAGTAARRRGMREQA